MFKVALGSRDFDLAGECLRIIADSCTDDPGLLYACCIEAQNYECRPQALEALQLVLEKYGYNETPSVVLPPLVRCAIKFLVAIIENSAPVENSAHSDASIEKLCKMFEGGPSLG